MSAAKRLIVRKPLLILPAMRMELQVVNTRMRMRTCTKCGRNIKIGSLRLFTTLGIGVSAKSGACCDRCAVGVAQGMAEVFAAVSAAAGASRDGAPTRDVDVRTVFRTCVDPYLPKPKRHNPKS